MCYGGIYKETCMVGDLTTYVDGNRAIHVTNRAVRFHNFFDTGDNKSVGSIYAAKRLTSEAEPGLAIAHEENSRLSLLYRRSGNTNPYIDFDMNNVLGNSSEYPIYFHQRAWFNRNVRLRRNLFLGTHNRIFEGEGARANQMILEVPTATGTGLRLMDTAGNVLHVYDPGADNRFYWNRSARFSSNLIVRGNLKVDGSKNAVHKTKNYDRVAINAYETAEYYNGDLGSGKLGEDGLLYVYIDDIFDETVNTFMNYHITYGKCGPGEIYTYKKYPHYFIVKGEPGLEFTWELKAKRDGYEY